MALLIGVLLLVVGTSSAQTREPILQPPGVDSLYVLVSVGSAPPTAPGAFAQDWQSGTALRLEVLYTASQNLSLSLGFEHIGFSSEEILTNPELRLISIMPSLTYAWPTRFAMPFVRGGAGLLQRGTRRMLVREGSFIYDAANGALTTWESGLILEGAAGVRLLPRWYIHPFAEITYRTGWTPGARLGHNTFRAGLVFNAGTFLQQIH